MKVDVLGVKIDDINMDDAVDTVKSWLQKGGKHYIVTPNPEILVAAQKDSRLKKILNEADLSIADGIGLKLSGKIRSIVPGTDLVEKLVELSAEKGFVVSFLGGREEVAKKCAECLKKKYPRLKVGFAGSGGEVDSEGEEVLTSDSGNFPLPPCDLLFVAFGHIKQEKWIVNNLKKMPVKITMGVGGAFDYLSGNVSRAPEWVRRLGFEWLFRLMRQPRRIRRQLGLFEYLWLLIST